MISLDDYKKYLIYFYNWPIDNTLDKINKRKKELTGNYSNEYLERIIFDTYNFAKDVLLSKTIDYGFYKIEIDEDTTSYISLGLHGGCHSDTLFIDSKGNLISEYLIKRIFGKYLQIDINCDEIEDNSDEEILSYYCRYYIYMQGFLPNINELKKRMLTNEKELIRKISID